MNKCVQVTFAEVRSTPRQVSFAHTSSLSQAWQKLGRTQLRELGQQYLQHVFRLGEHHSIRRFLRITFSGLLHSQSQGNVQG